MALAPNRLDLVRKTAQNFPVEFQQAHQVGRTLAEQEAFIRRVALRLYGTNTRFGLNGKRGDVNNLSQDAVSFKNPGSPAGGVEIIDVIANAGSGNPQPAWTDVTQATIDASAIGAWVDPRSGVMPTPTPPAPVTNTKSHDYWRQRLRDLNAIYLSELSREVSIDVEGDSLNTWRAHEHGWSNAMIRDDVRRSAEWADKHPGQSPGPKVAPSLLWLHRPFGHFQHPLSQRFGPAAWVQSEARLRARLDWLRNAGCKITVAMLGQAHWGPEKGHPEWTQPDPNTPLVHDAGRWPVYGWYDRMDEMKRRIDICRQEYGMEIVLSLWEYPEVESSLDECLAKTPHVAHHLNDFVCAVMNSWEIDETLRPADQHRFNNVVANAFTKPTGPHFSGQPNPTDDHYWAKSHGPELLFSQPVAKDNRDNMALRDEMLHVVATNTRVHVVGFEHSQSFLGGFTEDEANVRGQVCMDAGCIASMNGG